MFNFLKILFFLLILICSLTNYVLADNAQKKSVQDNSHQDNSYQENSSQEKTEQAHWVDKLHRQISHSVFDSARWFDSFFTTDDDNVNTEPKTKAKITLAWLPQSNQSNEFSTKFRIKVKLPNLKNKVSLVFSDDIDDDNFQTPISTNNALNETNTEYSLAFNYTQNQQEHKTLDHRIGVSDNTLFARSRYKEFIELSQKHVFLFEPEIYYFFNNNLEIRLRFDYNYRFSENDVFRADLNLKKSLTDNQIKLQQGFNILRKIDELSASIWRIEFENKYDKNANTMLDNYTISYKYRFSALRKWLFFEIEPFLEFPQQFNYDQNYGLALRVEGNFIK